jgi:hypothetical protein
VPADAFCFADLVGDGRATAYITAANRRATITGPRADGNRRVIITNARADGNRRVIITNARADGNRRAITHVRADGIAPAVANRRAITIPGAAVADSKAIGYTKSSYVDALAANANANANAKASVNSITATHLIWSDFPRG